MKIRTFLLCGTLVVTAPSIAFAQTAPSSKGAMSADADEDAASDIIVTATRSAKAIDKIPGAVTVISEKEVAQQFQIVDDPAAALAATIPGIAPSRQKLSSMGETIRGRSALTLLDGIPQANALRDARREGYFIDSALIQRIEVVSGASAMYGLGATGGIINYLTKSATEPGTQQEVHLRASTGFHGGDNLDWKAAYLVTHKSDAFDALGYFGYNKRGMLYDANGRALGLTPAVGDTMDTHSTNFFVKLGQSFGDQRIEGWVNKFKVLGEGDWIPEEGDALNFIPTTSVRGSYRPDTVVPYNDILSTKLAYTNENFLNGFLELQLFTHASDILFGEDTAPAFQDPAIAPIGELYDQGLLVDRKKGGKLTYVHPDIVMDGLELTVGADQLFNTTHHDLALTDRIWLTPLKYRSTAPFAQLEFDRGEITVRGGLRYEIGHLKVDDFTTIAYYGRDTNNWMGVPVEGGSRNFKKVVKNIGGIWRFADGFSVFAAYSEGFGLPDVGILLRSVTALDQSVSTLVSIDPVVTEAKEVGINLRRPWGSLGASAYESYSAFGSTLRVGADGLGQVVRVPTKVQGFELTAELKPVRDLKLMGTYSYTDGKTAQNPDGPLDLKLGGRSQGPNKLTAVAEWGFHPAANVRLQMLHFFDRDINEGRGTLRNGYYSLEEHFDGYTQFDLSSTFETGPFTIGLSVENLFNKQYMTYWSQFVRTNARDADKQYIAGRGRSYSLSLISRF